MFRMFQAAMIVALAAGGACAQDDSVPLGDVARAVRKSKPPAEEEVIDNDNFHVVMDKAESARLKGEPVFAIGNAGKTFTAVSPDGTCSLSFDARTIDRMRVPFIATDLPAEDLVKLDGPAAIENGVLQVALHNGTRWQLREITVGVAPIEARKDSSDDAAEIDGPQPVIPPATGKLPERSLIYHLRGSAAPDSTTVFQTLLDPGATELADWRWTIVAARGIPPASGGPGQDQLEASSPTLQPGPASSPLPPVSDPPVFPASSGSPSPDIAPDPHP